MSAGRAGCFAPVNARLFESRSVSDAEAPVPPVWSVRFAAEVARRSAFRCVLAGELPAPPGCANRCAGEGTPRDEPVRAFAAEVVASVSMVDRFGSDAESPSERAPCTAGGRSVRAGALRVRPRRGGRPGSWRSRPSLTSRPTSCPSVMWGSTCESSPLSCSSPRWQSASITALSSQRPSPSGRTRSAGTASAGSTSASIFVTSRVLLPAACSTSAFCADTSSTGPGFGSGAGFRWADRAGAGRAEPFGRTADPVPVPAPRARSRSLEAITPLEGGLQLRRRVQGQRAVPEPLAHALDPRAQLHGVDPAPGGGVAVAERALHVVEQAGEAAAQVHAAGFDLAQMIDDEDVDLVIEASQLAGLLQELVVGEAGYSGGDVGVQRGSRHDVNII